MLWDEPKIFFLERRYFFSIILSEFLKNRVALHWEREKLRKAFEKKYKNKFVYAKAQSRGTGADEEFYFEEAYEVSGFDYDAMIELLEQGRIYIDLRIGQYANGKTHDHGTGFRIREIDQPKLFKVNRKVV